MKDPWHFERRDFTAHVLSLLTQGPVGALSLFGPRRTGKTEFLLKDLAPRAQHRGHRVVYASFWQSPLSPLAVLLHALEASLAGASFGDRVRAAAVALAPRLKLSAPAPGAAAAAEIDLTALAGQPPSDLLLYLDDLLDRAAGNKKPTVLLLDEVQELAQRSGNEPLVAALRTGLDKRRTSIKTIFTGSSREGLAAVFTVRQAPFFHFATPIDLPALGDAFVAHVVAAFERMSGRTLNGQAMRAAFERLHNNPYFFRLFIEALLCNRDLSPPAALREVRDRIAVELGFANTWLTLTAIQRATARALADGARQPLGQPFRRTLAAHLKQPAPTAGRVQAALRRLQRLGVADTHTGTWSLVDPELAAWIRDQAGRG